MVAPPQHRLEVVFMANRASPIHIWMQSTPDRSRVFEYDETISLRIIGGAVLLLLFMFFLFPGPTVILFLAGMMVFFPLYVVGTVGYFRGMQPPY